MTYKSLVFVPFIVLAACGTPQERCINGANSEVTSIDRLITTTRGNIDRGYAVAEVDDVRVVSTICNGRNEDGTTYTYRCQETERFTREVPVSISVAEERIKLTELMNRRDAAARTAQAAAQQCVAMHPE